MAGNRSLGTLTLDLIAKIGGFTAPLDQAGRKLDKNLSAMEKRAKAFGIALGTSIVAYASAAAYAIKSSIDRMDELSKTSQKIGVTTEALSRLAYAADLSDVSLEQLQGGLAKMTKFQAAAAQGNKDAVATFKAFDIAITDSEGHLRGTESVLQDFAKVFAALPDGPEKTALAMRVFGKTGAELIPLLNEGADGLRDMAAEADRFGVTIDSVAGKQAEDFNDDLTRLQAQVKGLANEVAQQLLPELTKLAKAFSDMGQDGGDTFADVITNELGGVSKAIRGTLVEIEFLKKAWKEQGLFGEGILSVLDRANTEFQRREGLGDALDIHRGPLGRGTARKGAIDGQADQAAKRMEEASRKLLATTKESTGATRADTSARREASEAAKRHADALEELQQKIKEAADASAEFATRLEDLGAAGDPFNEAALQYKRDLADVRALADKGEVSTTKLAEAERLLGEQYGKTTDEIRKRLDTGGAQIQQMEGELRLLNMQTDAERQRAQFLIDNPTATKEEADAFSRLNSQIDETRKNIAAMDDVRNMSDDFFTGVITGSESGIDALKNFADAFSNMLARMASDYLTSQLFGERGTTGGGLFGKIFGALFGGGSSSSSFGGNSSAELDYGFDLTGSYANGTNYAPGGWALVGEQGPEIVNLPRGAQVIPNNKAGRAGGGMTQNNNFYLEAPTEPRTQQQIAARTGFEARRAMARNG